MIRPAAICGLLLLGGCVSFGGKPPKMLMTLTTSATVPTDAVRQASAENTVLILTPTANAAVQTVRIPVYDGTALAYVADGAWNEPPVRAIQRLLSETVTARTAKIVLDPRQFGASPAMRLSGQLQRFGIDPNAMQAVATFDAQLSREGGRVETRRFEARAPLAAVDAAQAGTALNRAANDLAMQVADWVK
ncbi:ABC-type transport auxiliary lipoprotein family protein [Sphingomonas sp. SUN039]|uniref:ABC-type transport auxiliary lipoprotein family protein n=1 Tax=Sphingomonas sp. SUN039 TaxID=2937787 RepID=UPI0021648537|nr:ABC-type transport auxiliary lipoprotein family protein [Sphingomonas sp. SUN039]UVO54760.1 ABC-type transport auxiliary lipoprotein family protein [Sphingomonas sp. SUN039]